VIELLGRRPKKVVAVALANKMARIAWAVLAKGEPYRTLKQRRRPSGGLLQGYVEGVEESRG
jgi:hypothetical protein